ncbi:MAG: hypothetical protein SO082_03995 [Candidatus Limisoma sp.]|nr:hypothetical protein [Muribaculaceae bacterium]MDY4942347.1 hypothetical protein [Candidatus Limisoma sp.]
MEPPIREKSEKTAKDIGVRRMSVIRQMRMKLLNNWCLTRSKMLYYVLSLLRIGEARINIVMRCRENTEYDWGHAWVTLNGKPFMERKTDVINKSKKQISDTGKFIYWIYE